MRPHIKPFDINDYAHRKVRYILREEHGNQDLVHTIRDHYFGHEQLVSMVEAEQFVRDVEARSSPSVSSWNSTGLGRMCLMPKRSNKREARFRQKENRWVTSEPKTGWTWCSATPISFTPKT